MVCASSMFLIGCTGEKGTINYEFSGTDTEKAGYAEGTITFKAKEAGTYNLYWSDDIGALEGYYEIVQMELEENANAEISFEAHTAIPADATKIIAVRVSEDAPINTMAKDAVAVYDIPKEKQLGYKSADALYTFNSYSDIHIDEEKWGETPAYWWEYSEQHWADALDYATKKDTDFIIATGDQVTNATYKYMAKEWQSYQYILASSDYVNPVYESGGNHEIRQAGLEEEGLADFIFATGLDSTKKTIKEFKPYYSINEPKTGDLFIFMALEGGYKPAKEDEFSKEQLDWVKGLLKENYGTGINIYLIQHANISGYGPGDDVENPYYEGGMDATLPLNAEFKALLEEYKDIIWISGHTHEAYELGYNYTNDGGAACHMIHNSSVGNPTYVTDGEIDYSFNEDKSQGYYVEVFEKVIVFHGANLCDEKIYPAYCYIIDGDTKAEEVEEKTYRTDWAMTAGKVRSIKANAKSVLGVYYEYSSYDNYQRLKKSYYKYKDADIDAMTEEELSAMYDELGKGIRSLCELVEGVELVALTKK